MDENSNQKDELALREFGVRYRLAHKQEHPISEISIHTVTQAVRDQYEQEKDAKRGKTIEPPTPEKERGPDEPDQDR
jgi:hypothetical protein